MGIEVLLGQTLSKIIIEDPGRSILFETVDGSKYRMFHQQDCCESVLLEDIIGDVQDLIGSPILEAEETTDGGWDDEHESYTWTFYKLGTIKGHVNIRWFGSSNGYYSESVDFEKVEK